MYTVLSSWQCFHNGDHCDARMAELPDKEHPGCFRHSYGRKSTHPKAIILAAGLCKATGRRRCAN